MAFLGNDSTTQSFVPAVDYFTADGSTLSYTLSRPVASVAQVEVVVNNVVQNPSDAYTVNGNTITFTSAPAVGGTNNVYVKYTSPITQVVALPQDPVVYGNVNLNTAGARILGDFTTTPQSKRVMFQTTTPNSPTRVNIIPSGTNTTAAVAVVSNSSPDNASWGQLSVNDVAVNLSSTISGSGTYIPLIISTNSQERMRFGTDGLITIPSGQIKFPATQNASADANTLDDYEEGTFTPELYYGSTPASGAVYSSRQGVYQKIGNQVIVSFLVVWSNKGTGSGEVYFAAPFPIAKYAAGTYTQNNIGLKSGCYAMGIQANVGGLISLYGLVTGGQKPSYLYADLPASGEFIISITYQTTA